MTLLDRLRPKWHHSDPAVRAEAVRDLGRDDQELLGAVARQDEDRHVRRLAIKKLDDPDVLLEVARADADEGLRELAAERAGVVWTERATSHHDERVSEGAMAQLTDEQQFTTVAIAGVHMSVRRAALSRVAQDKALGEIVRKADDSSIREGALDRVRDPAVLRTIASSDCPSELALRALERIDDPDSLHTIVTNRVVHKNVRQRAEAKLEKVLTDDHPLRVRARHERQLELAVMVETQAGDPDPEQAANHIRVAREEWASLAARTEPEERTRHRFEQACNRVFEELTRRDRLRVERERLDAELAENLAARRALCERVEALEGESALRELARARAEWGRIEPVPEGVGEGEGVILAKRFTEAGEGCQVRHERWRARDTFQSKLEALTVEAEQVAQSPQLGDALRRWAVLEDRWARLEGASQGVGVSRDDVSARGTVEKDLRERFAKAGEDLAQRQRESREHQEQERQANLAAIAALCARLEEIAGAEELDARNVDRELQAATAILRQMGPLPPSENRRAWKDRLGEARQRLSARLQDERDTERWKLWANAEAQQKLIEQADALLGVQDLADVARQLRRIQDEWKRFGTAPRDQSQTLWERFRQTRDELRSRCDAFFADNLAKKEALCERVEQLADSTEWKETAEVIKGTQAEWKDIGPVAQKHAKALWQRFRAPCDQFFERRNQHFEQVRQEREENARAKQALCEKVEALADSTEWGTVTEQIKRIQAEWKQIGPAPHKVSEKLWTRFRAACDRFFDRRNRRGQVEIEQRLAKAESICVELEALVAPVAAEGEAAAPAIIVEKVKECWDAWNRIGPVQQEKITELNARFLKACEQIAAAHPDSVRGTGLDPESTRKRREKICARLQELVESFGESAAEPTIEDLAERLKRSLAANRIGGSAKPEDRRDWRGATREVDRLKVSWDRLGPPIGTVGQTLAERFQAAYAKFFELRRTAQAATRKPETLVSRS
jgi:hypothetical protein